MSCMPVGLTSFTMLGMSRIPRTIQLERRIRLLLLGFIVGLVLSGLTAFPLPQEVALLASWLGAPNHPLASTPGGLTGWIVQVRDSLSATEARYPFLFYGYDWLAFAHLVIAVLFMGPVRDPVRNIWVIQWGMIACAFVPFLALICGAIRGIPFAWQLIDCSFGVVGIIPLYVCFRATRELESLGKSYSP